ncbi:dirigent protein 22-like [Miscanthus floridulus]|uniref:dirigent protein 22-like n=1 Tax=Miscanthus floridulus TaxID=154761 RepID=UPI0034586064
MAKTKISTVQLQLILISMALTTATATATTHLQFYMHDIVTTTADSPATGVRVARGTTPLPGDPGTPARFGDMHVIDDPLTEGPDAASPAVGRAQGFYPFADQQELAAIFSLNIVFTAGKHNGSYLVVNGKDAFFDEVRELAVIGGAGRFRGATGYGLLTTHYFNSTTKNAVVKIDMYLKLFQGSCQFTCESNFVLGTCAALTHMDMKSLEIYQ